MGLVLISIYQEPPTSGSLLRHHRAKSKYVLQPMNRPFVGLPLQHRAHSQPEEAGTSKKCSPRWSFSAGSWGEKLQKDGQHFQFLTTESCSSRFAGTLSGCGWARRPRTSKGVVEPPIPRKIRRKSHLLSTFSTPFRPLGIFGPPGTGPNCAAGRPRSPLLTPPP